jgi:hypothetical protein
MQRLRFWFAGFFLWFFVLYNIERYHEPINLASFTYVLVAGIGAVLIAFPRLGRIGLPWLMLAPLPLFFALKMWLRYPILGSNLPITVTELCTIEVTLMLAWHIGRSLATFREAVADVMTAHLPKHAQSFETGQGEIYREIRRARHYDRPLSVLAVTPSQAAVDRSLNRFIEEVQRETIDRYVNARIAHLLAEDLRASDIIAQRDGHFITVLPETDQQQALELVEKLTAAAREKLGLDLQVGLATFPEQEVTFNGLVERAERTMRNGDAALDASDLPANLVFAGGNGHKSTNQDQGKTNGRGNGQHHDGAGQGAAENESTS